MTQSINEQIGAAPAIEPERHLVQVGREMLCTNLVPASNDAALQERKCRLDSVGRDTSAVLVPGVFLGAVINSFMFSVDASGRHRVLVSRPIVCYQNFHVLTNVLFDILSESACAGISCVEETEIAVALPYADDDLFRFLGCFGAATEHLSAYVGFVHFDSTVKHRL